MANQAIALQARAPQQSNILGGALQQGAQMINMMSQQRAAERQAAVAQQQMEIARAAEERAAAKEGRDIKEFQLKLANDAATIFRDGLASWAQPGDVAAAQALRDQVVELVPAWDKIIPSADVLANDPKARRLASMKAGEIIEYTMTKPEVEVQVQPGTGVLQEVRTGGIEGISPRGAFELPEFEIDPNAGKPSAAPQSAFPATTARATDAQIDEAARKILRGAGVAELGIGAEDFDRATERANQMTAGGGRMQPISMTTGAQMGGGQPDLTAVVEDMMSSGQISQSNLQLMREMAGPDKDAQLAQILKANNIQIVPDDQPGMRSAVFRPGQDAAPRMQLAQAMEGYRPTGRAARGKDPMQSPAPGTVLVPTPVIRKQAEAEEAGKLGSRITAEPQIEGGKKTAELRAQRDFEMPQATGRFETNLARMDTMLAEIERLRKHDAYTRIIGPVDAFTPNVGRARGAQAIYNSLMALGTAEELQSMRRGNETGGAVGNVSDADIKLLERGFGALDQSQMEEDFDASVDVLVNRIKAARARLIKEYKDTYSYRLPKNWSPPSPKSKPTQGGRKVGGFTVLEVED